jgi:hypothetical protein
MAKCTVCGKPAGFIMNMCPACIDADTKQRREKTEERLGPQPPINSALNIHKEPKDMDIGRIVKTIAIIEGVLSVIIALVLISKVGNADDGCSAVSSLSYFHCLSVASAATESARWIAAGWAIGGIMTAVVIYCIGYIACKADENNRLLLNVLNK